MLLPKFKLNKLATLCSLALLPTSLVYAGMIKYEFSGVVDYVYEHNNSGFSDHISVGDNFSGYLIFNSTPSNTRSYRNYCTSLYCHDWDQATFKNSGNQVSSFTLNGEEYTGSYTYASTENDHVVYKRDTGEVSHYHGDSITMNAEISYQSPFHSVDFNASDSGINLLPNTDLPTQKVIDKAMSSDEYFFDAHLSGDGGWASLDLDEFRFIDSDELAELESAKVNIDGDIYTVPVTKGFYSEIMDGDGNIVEGGVDATVAARLYAASQMLYDIENYNGQQLVDAQFENSIETQQAMIDARRWEAEARHYSAASVAAVTGSVAVAACTVGLTVPILGAVSCVGASAGWAIGNLVNIGANELQEASTSAQSTWIYDSGIALLDEMQRLAPQVETSAASLIAKGKSGVLSYSEILDANLKVDMVRKHDEAVSNLFTAAPMDLDNAQLFLETVVNGAAGVDPKSILGPTLSILSTVRDTDIKIHEYLELSGSLDMDGYYDKAHVSDSIISLYASIALDTGLAGSSNNNQQSVQQTVDNFDSGSLGGNWLVDGPGKASIEEIFVLDSPESVLLLETGSPISVAQELFNTPDSPFYIDFDYLFGTSTGQLDIYFNDLLLDSLFAADFTGDNFLTHTLAINDPSFYGLSSSMLEFYFDGDTGSQVFIDNISLNSVVSKVPEPESIAIFALGVTGLALGRRRRNPKH